MKINNWKHCGVKFELENGLVVSAIWDYGSHTDAGVSRDNGFMYYNRDNNLSGTVAPGTCIKNKISSSDTVEFAIIYRDEFINLGTEGECDSVVGSFPVEDLLSMIFHLDQLYGEIDEKDVRDLVHRWTNYKGD